MSDIPYTRKELESIGSQLPDRGALCPRCGVHIPQFAELSVADARRIRLMCQGQPFLATCEVQTFTGCPQDWARMWVEHRGFPNGSEKTPICNSSSRPQGKAYDIHQILATPDVSSVISSLSSALEMTRDNLNTAEADWLAAYESWIGVHCDGLEGWLFNNPDIVPVEEARDGFRAIGALGHAKVMQQVRRVFSVCSKSEDPGAFSDILGLHQTKTKLAAFQSAFDAADAEANLEELLRAYVVQHIDKFK